MATSIKRLGVIALRFPSRIPLRSKNIAPLATHRNFHVTSTFRADDGENGLKEELNGSRNDTSETNDFERSLSSEERNTYDYLSREEKLQYQEDMRKYHQHMNSSAVISELTAEASRAALEVSQEIDPEDFKYPKINPGVMAEGEDDEQGSGEDEEFKGDDISSAGHGELEQHREMREYARIAAWEMPLLSKFAKPFRPPPSDRPLRFRYTTYMGETHPAEKKIVVEFCTRDLPDLTDAQRIKLIKLVGPRYNPETDIVKMSCEMFETQAQNKRYLGDLVNTLMAEAKNSSDMFEDVPMDFRHHRFMKRTVFPPSWKMTPERERELESEKEKRSELEERRSLNGLVVDGVASIENWLKDMPSLSTRPVESIGGKTGVGSESRVVGRRQAGERRSPRQPVLQ